MELDGVCDTPINSARCSSERLAKACSKMKSQGVTGLQVSAMVGASMPHAVCTYSTLASLCSLSTKGVTEAKPKDDKAE